MVLRILPRAAVIALLAVTLATLAGCYESADVSYTMSSHQNDDTYKGKTDPLLAKLKNSQLQDELDSRFEGQTDR